ncbi:MAG: BMP family protein [Nitrospinota bacterium]
MKKGGKGVLGFVLLVALVVWGWVVVPAGPSVAAEKVKVMLLLPGVIGDQAWNAAAYRGLVDTQKALGVRMDYLESVRQADFEEILRDLGVKGYNIVICHGTQFTDAAEKISPLFPKTQYWIVAGYKAKPPNLGSIALREWEAGYVAGVIAGMMTKNNKIASLGGFPYPIIAETLAGYEAAAKRFNPKVKVTSIYLNSWSDVAKGKEQTKALIEAGNDVVYCVANETCIGVAQAAQEGSVRAIGNMTDQSSIAPNAVMQSVLFQFSSFFKSVVQRYQGGTLKAAMESYGFKEGMWGLSGYHASVPQRVKGTVDQVIDELKAGKIPYPHKPKKK